MRGAEAKIGSGQDPVEQGGDMKDEERKKERGLLLLLLAKGWKDEFIGKMRMCWTCRHDMFER